MKQTASRSVIVIVITVLFTAGILLYYGRLTLSGAKWATYPTNQHLYDNGKLVTAGTITDANDVVLAQTTDGKRSFHESTDVRKATVHAVGDLEGFVSTGVHAAFLPQLTGYELINGTYNRTGEGNDMQLTIDSELCVSAMKALGSRSGTVGICNYKTGEILCMVSTPTFDPEHASADAAANGKGVFVNRLLSGTYTPGSIFKLVTCLSALENFPDFDQRTYTCEHGVTIQNEWLSCLVDHDTLGIRDALAQSCNATFAQVALDVGRPALTKTAEKIGFNKQLTMDGIQCAKSSYMVDDANDIDFGWSGIGQYNDLVNPFQYLTFMCAIANDGVCVSPHLVKSITTPDGIRIRGESKSSSRRLSRQNAEQLQEFMRNNVLTKYGDSAFSGLELCAKTGTAEIGKGATPHSWFVGFCQSEEKPYAFVVVVENAGSGLGVASSIAARVLRAAEKIEG